ncbi:hypothetical protein [Streptomyces cyaneus]|uniref:hypothetical protein n=1 Tax=Streptomyces cyaneus TaxID=1904 RepID=UPI0013E2F007|nr:hypothetical protein [Streptomyces cyaneus]
MQDAIAAGSADEPEVQGKAESKWKWTPIPKSEPAGFPHEAPATLIESGGTIQFPYRD